jgi:nicotinate-nucleotide pyrophosphorylase (carboxylating)
MRPGQNAMKRLVRMALAEDAPWGDVTSQTLIPASTRMTAELVAREPGVLCGKDLFTAAMAMTDKTIVTEFHVEDTERFEKGMVLARVHGPARSVLQAAGVATLTARYVSETAGTKARIVDTRKTTPGFRELERYAVRCGGGNNHRFSLSDAVLAKDNHLAVLTANGSRDLTEALREVRSRLPHTMHLEVEVDRADQIDAVLSAGVDTIMLDNFTTEALRAAVNRIAGRAIVEASGGIKLESIREIAATGVDVISVGALTHSVRALDLALDAAVL